MSARKDNSQGFGFIYVDVKALLKQREEIEQHPEIHPQEGGAQTFFFPKRDGAAELGQPQDSYRVKRSS